MKYYNFTAKQWLILGGLGAGTIIISLTLFLYISSFDWSPMERSEISVTPTGLELQENAQTEDIMPASTVKSTSPTPLIALTTSATPELSSIISFTPTWKVPVPPDDADLNALIAKMTLEEKIGQMLIVGFSGQSLSQSPELGTMIEQYHIGGVVMLESNAHDPQQISALTSDIQALAMSSGARLPLFVSINHEGGIVVRITEGVTGFPGNMGIAATGEVENAYLSAALAAQELRAMGINMNLAPVLDINDNPLNPVIGVRSFSDDPLVVAKYGKLTIQGFQENGVLAVAKHFPGHGSVDVDSHGGLPMLKKDLDEIWQHELYPFSLAVDAGVASIMTAHISVPAIDESGLPATLSYPILTQILREKMHYDGLIMTDSLGMAGVSEGRGQAKAAVESIKAGADIVLSTSPMNAHTQIFHALIDAVHNGYIAQEQVDSSVLRILRAKYGFGLLSLPPLEALEVIGNSRNKMFAEEMASQAVTVLRDDANNIPLKSPPAHILVVSPDHLSSTASGQGTLFGELLRQAGYSVTEVVLNLNSVESRNQVYAMARTQYYDSIVFGEWELIKREVNWGDQWQATLIAYLNGLDSPLIVIAWHNPAAIVRCPADVSFLTAYGNTDAQVKAIIGVLTGELGQKGQLPMTFPSFD